MGTLSGIANAGSIMWARSDARRRWRSMVVLGVLAGLSAGLCLAAVAGARRTSTAFARLREQTRSADAVVFPSQAGIPHPDWTRLQHAPYIEGVARWNLLFGNQDGQPGGLLFAPSDNVWLNEVDRPVVIDGRMFDRSRPDEVVVDEELVKVGVHVGTRFRFQFYRPGHSDLDGRPPDGLEMTFRVVGVVRETSEFLFTGGLVLTSPALMAQNGSEISAFENAHVRLRDWSSGMAKLERDANRLLGPGVPVLDLHQVETRVSTSITIEQAALVALATVVALAGLVFVGQALARSVDTIERDIDPLRASGLARRDIVVAATLPHVIVAAVAGGLGLVTAIALSPRFPIGFARRIDPGIGTHVDLTVLLPGVLLTFLMVLAGSALVAARLDRPPLPERDRPRRFLAAVRSITPVPIGLGATLAVDARTRHSVGGRLALVGAVVGVLGLAGTLAVVHGLDDALSHPARVGVTWDAGVTPAANAVDLTAPDLLDHRLVDRIVGDHDVGDMAVLWRAPLDANGVGVPSLARVDKLGKIPIVTVAGRPPRSDHEVAIGPATAHRLGVDIGDTIAISGRRHEVVGRALFPPEVHSGFDEGLLLTWPELRRLAPPPDMATGTGPLPYFAVRWKPGVASGHGLTSLTRSVADPSAQVAPAEIPPELTNLRGVRRIPVWLAAFVVFIAVSTLLHALITGLAARRAEFGVLRSIGFTRRMVAEVVLAQSTTVGVVGCVLGLPLGLALGRWAWVWLAANVPLVYVSPLMVGLTLALVPLTIVAANFVSVWPAVRAARQRVADALRSE